uniref:40S ribosomal protein S15 n=1 Tax=Ascaris lumbricoides TaxID=6252 RepID=A0A0M3HF86_ASCLU
MACQGQIGSKLSAVCAAGARMRRGLAAQRREQPLAWMRPLFVLEFIHQFLSEDCQGADGTRTFGDDLSAGQWKERRGTGVSHVSCVPVFDGMINKHAMRRILEKDQLVPNDRLTEKFDIPTGDFSRLVL